jgi:hypothetical protein
VYQGESKTKGSLRVKVTPNIRKCSQVILSTTLLGKSRRVSSVACAQSLFYSQGIIMSAALAVAPLLHSMLYSDSLVIRGQKLAESQKTVSKL